MGSALMGLVGLAKVEKGNDYSHKKPITQMEAKCRGRVESRDRLRRVVILDTHFLSFENSELFLKENAFHLTAGERILTHHPAAGGWAQGPLGGQSRPTVFSASL